MEKALWAEKMQKCLENLEKDLQKIRTGRASPELLDHIQAEIYGDKLSLNQVAAVHAEGPRTLVVTPWDKSSIAAIDKAIKNSDLGLNPSVNGDVIRVSIPGLTEERRKEYIKVAKEAAEKARVAVRNIRRSVMQEAKNQVKDKLISSDDERRWQAVANELTDDYVGRIDAKLVEKEKALMVV